MEKRRPKPTSESCKLPVVEDYAKQALVASVVLGGSVLGGCDNPFEAPQSRPNSPQLREDQHDHPNPIASLFVTETSVEAHPWVNPAIAVPIPRKPSETNDKTQQGVVTGSAGYYRSMVAGGVSSVGYYRGGKGWSRRSYGLP